MNNKKGFTLIELLIVIAIIGILAAALLVSLGGARRAARDARRISDLRNVQAALELYNNANNGYPNSTTWAALTAALTAPSTGVNQVPNDPLGGTATYTYANAGGRIYVLQATLESDNAALAADLDAMPTAPTGTTWTPASLQCADASPNYGYCVSI